MLDLYHIQFGQSSIEQFYVQSVSYVSKNQGVSAEELQKMKTE